MRTRPRGAGWLPAIVLAAATLVVAGAGSAERAAGRQAFDAGDYRAAFRELLPLADTGDAEAQYLVGLMYSQGNAEIRDYEKAAAWLRQAAEQGHGYAEYALGLLYEDGNGVKRSRGEALRWFRRAANRGVQPAMNYLPKLGGGGR